LLNQAITRTTLPNSGSSLKTALPRRERADQKREMRRSNRLAWLVVDGQTQGFHCTLREFSTEGAHLTVSGLMGIPDQFSLYIEPDAIKYSCAVVLRKGNSVKVTFSDCEENVRFRDLAGRR